MVGDDRAPKFMDKFWAKASKDPFVPIGALATVGFLVSGIYSFKQGNKRLSQQLMRGRVAAQGFTIVVMCAGLYMAGPPATQRQTVEAKMAAVSNQPNRWAKGGASPPAEATATLDDSPKQ